MGLVCRYFVYVFPPRPPFDPTLQWIVDLLLLIRGSVELFFIGRRRLPFHQVLLVSKCPRSALKTVDLCVKEVVKGLPIFAPDGGCPLTSLSGLYENIVTNFLQRWTSLFFRDVEVPQLQRIVESPFTS